MIVARSRRVFQVVCLLHKCRPTCRYALYAIVMGVVYILGLPLGVFIMLYRRRRKLFGSADADPVVAATQATYGFLYLGYGPSAWWWEVEELVRKLLLSAVVVLFESGSPLQVCVETMGVLTKLVVPLAVTCISVASHSANISGTVCPPLPTYMPSTDYTGSAVVRLGSCPACDVQTMGCGVHNVQAAARQPVRDFLRVRHGRHKYSPSLFVRHSQLQGATSRAVPAAVS